MSAATQIAFDRLRKITAEAWKKESQPRDTIVLKGGPVFSVLKAQAKGRTVKVRISSETPDRDNDTVKLDGWDTSRYNGVVLFGHRSEDLPVGKSSVYREGRFLMADAALVSRDEYDFGGCVGDMVLNGWLPSASVGFLPHEWEKNDDRQDAHGLPGFDFKKQELLEWSFVSVPSNFEADVVGARMAGIDVTPIRAWAEKGLAAELGPGLWMTRKELERVYRTLSGNKVHSLPPAAGKGAVAYGAAPVVEGSWDAGAAVERLKKWASSDGSGDKDKMDWPKYSKGFAWFDSSKKDSFGSYKLPHHDVKDGKLVTAKAGVQAAGGVLSGARGGADLDDESAVKSHIAKHYHQFDAKAPWEKSDDDKGADVAGKNLLPDDPTHQTDPDAGSTPDYSPDGKDFSDFSAKMEAFHLKLADTLDAHDARTKELYQKLHTLAATLAALHGVSGDGQGGDTDTAGGAEGLRGVAPEVLVAKLTDKLRRKLLRRHARAAAEIALLDLEVETKKLEEKAAGHPAHALSKKQLKHIRKAKRHLSRSLALHEAADAQATGTEGEPTGDGSPKDTNTAKPDPGEKSSSTPADDASGDAELDETAFAKLIEAEGAKVADRVGKQVTDLKVRAGIK